MRLSLLRPLLVSCACDCVPMALMGRGGIRRRCVHLLRFHLLGVRTHRRAAAGLSFLANGFSCSLNAGPFLRASLRFRSLGLLHLTVVQFDHGEGEGVHGGGDDGRGLPLPGLRGLLAAIAITVSVNVWTSLDQLRGLLANDGRLTASSPPDSPCTPRPVEGQELRVSAPLAGNAPGWPSALLD
ncbi:hypothetical protein EYF80_001237 [Liparis tanakae]|uniref:Uncharacterized protein n=1 Tax=Liparis tanakae TaxID=230148 RepID=A0A4Z2JDU8_9TELE|nr:hypothetical protein EYF80_001237 [Liparis tanakae]